MSRPQKNLIELESKAASYASLIKYKLPKIILSVVVMGIVLYFLLGFFSDKFDYNESWKFIYMFIIVIISLIS